MSSATMSGGGPIQQQVQEKLTKALAPTFLDIVNESYKHNVPKGAESHFKVTVVSDAFEGKSLLERHRMVNDTLEEELKGAIHALSIRAKTPGQWEKSADIHETPNCRGGSKK